MRNILSYIILLSVFAFACNDDKSACFKTVGEQVIQERVLTSDFSAVKIQDDIDLVISVDTFKALSIECGKNLQPFIELEFNGNWLVLKNNNTCNFLRDLSTPIKAHLTINSLDLIDLRGFADIVFLDTLEQDIFRFEAWDGGGNVDLKLKCKRTYLKQIVSACDVTVSGQTDLHYVFNTGSGWWRTFDYKARECYVINGGTGDIQVDAEEGLQVEIYQIGNIVYQNDPLVRVVANEGRGTVKPY